MWKHLKSKILSLQSLINSEFLIIQFGLDHHCRKACSGILRTETTWELGMFGPLKTLLRTVIQMISTQTDATLDEWTPSLPQIYESSSGKASPPYPCLVVSRNKWKWLLKNNPGVQILFIHSDCTFLQQIWARESLLHFSLNINILPVIFLKSCY